MTARLKESWVRRAEVRRLECLRFGFGILVLLLKNYVAYPVIFSGRGYILKPAGVPAIRALQYPAQDFPAAAAAFNSSCTATTFAG
jgi:hypothetical protein